MYGEMKEHVVDEAQVIITNIIPAQGWKAIFVTRKEDSEGYDLSSEPVICWGLETLYDNHYSMHPIKTRVVGMVSLPDIVSAEDLVNFVGYLENNIDATFLSEYAEHLLQHMPEEDEDEGDD